MLDFLWLINHL